MGWEYHAEVFDFSKAFFSMGGLFDSEKFNIEVNRLGWENWELTSVFDTNRNEGGTRLVVAVFKRPLTDQRRAEISSQLATK